MANKAGRCIICGQSPTVKSHLFPRAMIFDIRADQNSVVQGSRHRDGIRLFQSGEWDDQFLCKVHEDRIGSGDDYTIRFCRSLETLGRPAFAGRATAVPNPQPDRLLHFIYGTVWRHAMSVRNAADKLTLGRYEAVLRQALLDDGPYDLQALVGIQNLTLGKHGKVNFALNPYRQKLGSLNTWHFVVGGLDFHLLTDRRGFNSDWKPYLANGNDPIYLTAIDPKDMRTVPMLRPLFDRMLKRDNL